MSQFDFGTIDPFVTNGEQLADMLNDWRDAIHSMHRGSSRPSYVVPGMMWVDDSGGPTSWLVKVYLGVTPGDKTLFTYNTSTGTVTVSAGVGGTLEAAILYANDAAAPKVNWNNSGNGSNIKRWQAVVTAAGELRFNALADDGTTVQQYIELKRAGYAETSYVVGVQAGGVTYTPIVSTDVVAVFPSVSEGNAGSWLNTANGKWTPPAGRYYVGSTIGVQAPIGGNGTWTMKIRKNGSTVINGESGSGSAQFSIPITLFNFVTLNGTDYIEILANHGTAGMSIQGGSFTAFKLP